VVPHAQGHSTYWQSWMVNLGQLGVVTSMAEQYVVEAA
jgi:hypothetical protein